jgi:hypothetical protein
MFDKVIGKRHGGTDVLGRHIVLVLDLIESGSSGDLGENARHRHARSPDDRLAVMYARVDLNVIPHDLNHTQGLAKKRSWRERRFNAMPAASPLQLGQRLAAVPVEAFRCRP